MSDQAPAKLWYQPFLEPNNDPKLKNEDLLSKITEKDNLSTNDNQKMLELCLRAILNFPKELEPKILFVKYAFKEWMFDKKGKFPSFLGYCLEQEYAYIIRTDSELELFNLCFKVIEDGLWDFPNNKFLLNLKGICLYILRKFSEACDIFEAVCLENADWIPAFINKALVLQSLKEHELAFNFYETLKLRFPNDIDIRIFQGKLYTKLFLFDQALKVFESAFPLDKMFHVQIYANMGRVKFLQKDFTQARHFFDKAILEDPDNPTTNLFYGDYLAYHRNWPEALLKYTIFWSQVKIHRDVENKIKHVNEEKNFLDTEKCDLPNKIKAVTSYELDSYLWSINSLFRQGLYNPSLDFLKKMKEICPKNPDIRLFLAKIYINFNNCSSAVLELNEGLASINLTMSWQTHFSAPLLAYKMELLEKKALLFKLIIEIAGIEIDDKIIAVVQARNLLFDSVFRLYKGKLMLKYFYLPKDQDFENELTKIKIQVENFRIRLKNRSSSLYIPFFIQNDKALLKYYKTLSQQIYAFEEIYANEQNLGTEGKALKVVLNNIDPLVKLYPPTSKMKERELNLFPSNLGKLNESNKTRAEALQNIVQLMTKNSTDRIHTAFKNKEIRLFVNQGLFGKYYQYFESENEKTTSSNEEALAKIDALKLMMILFRASYVSDSYVGLPQKTTEIVELSKIEFTGGSDKGCCLCFK